MTDAATTSAPAAALPDIDPVPALLARVRGELAGQFDPHRPVRVSRAPARLDVIGRTADYNGSPGGKSRNALRLAELCQMAENRIVGAPCGIMDQVTSCLGEADALLRMVCQPHDVQSPLRLPDGVRVLGINSGVKHDVGGPAYART